jgi:hypothetical protein
MTLTKCLNVYTFSKRFGSSTVQRAYSVKAEGQNNPFLYIISRFLFTVERQSFRNAIFSRSTFQNIIKAQMLSRDTAANLRHVTFSMLEKVFAVSKQGPAFTTPVSRSSTFLLAEQKSAQFSS